MNENEFWRIIEMTNYSSAGDGEKQAELLVEYLSQLSEGEILDFDHFYEHYMVLAFDRSLWDAAGLIEGWCSDDGFMDFRAWLVAQGRHIFETALANPDDLADFIDYEQDTLVEPLTYASMHAYEKKTGNEEIPSLHRGKQQIKGERTKEADLPTKYPKLYAKFVTDKKDSE